MANKSQQNLNLVEELLGGSRPLRRSGPTSLNLGEELLGGSDKLTIQDYLDFFGDKSAEADVVLEELTRQIEDQRFGRVMSSKDYRNEQLAAAMSDEELMNLTMGLVGGGGGLKSAGQAIRRGGKNILDIFREMMGRGKGEVGDIAFRRGSQPSQYTPSIIQKPLGQQELFSQEPVNQAVRRALQLPKQQLGKNLPARRMQDVRKEGYTEGGSAMDYFRSGEYTDMLIRALTDSARRSDPAMISSVKNVLGLRNLFKSLGRKNKQGALEVDASTLGDFLKNKN